MATAVAVLLSAAAPHRLHDADTVPPVDTARCFSTISAGDDDDIAAECTAPIDNERTAKADRIKALTARAGVFARKDQTNRAIAYYYSHGAAARSAARRHLQCPRRAITCRFCRSDQAEP